MTSLKLSNVQNTANHLRRRTAAAFSTPLYRNGYALILSSAMTSGLGLVYWALAARFYNPALVGFSSAALSAMVFLSGVSQLSLSGVLVRFIPQAGQQTARLVGSSYLLSALLAVPACFIFFVGLDWWTPSLHSLLNTPWKLMFFTLATMSWSIFVLQDSAFAGLRQSVWVPLENAFFAFAKIGLLLLFVSLIPKVGVFASWIIPVILLLLPVNLLIFSRLIPRKVQADSGLQSPLFLSQVAAYIGGNYVGSLFFLAYTTLLPILVIEMAGPAANAYFYLPWTIMSSLQLISVNMTMSLTVEAAHEQDKMEVYGRRVLVHVFKILGPIVIVILLGASFFLRIFGNQYAGEGATLLRLLALALLPHLIISLSISLARIKNRSRSILITQASLCLLVLGLSYLLLPMFGITGVGIAWLASYTLVAGILLVTQLRALLIPQIPG
jgi:O-antigen/teichoic acid export membrane protein